MIEIPRSRASVDELKLTTCPSSSIVPEVGDSTPDRIFMSVDLPAPFSPKSAVTVTRWTSNATPLSARVLPYGSQAHRTSNFAGVTSQVFGSASLSVSAPTTETFLPVSLSVSSFESTCLLYTSDAADEEDSV